MAEKTSTAKPDLPELVAARDKVKMLEEKRDRLAAMKEEDHAPGGHDLKAARDRNAAQITEAKQYVKKLSGS